MTTTAIQFDQFCLSSYLALRYVADKSAEWLPGLSPPWPSGHTAEPIGVRDADQLLDALRMLATRAIDGCDCGLLLSGGIDSAILAALLPRGTRAYTIRFDAPNAVDECTVASRFAAIRGLKHRVITVTWADYERQANFLMRHKRSPLHPVEVGLFVAATAARADGIDTLMVGNGADSNFGGLDQLLSRNWKLDEFIRRYTFVAPEAVLREPVSVRETFAAYDAAQGFDTVAFLKQVHGQGIIQAFDNAITAADCQSVEPYESLQLSGPLDLARIRRGESKYLLREAFQTLYPGLPIPQKVAFARPMDEWMKIWHGPRRPEFVEGLDVTRFSGEQKWLVRNLERFLDLFESA